MQARIYQPARNVMQSGRGKTDRWVLEFDQGSARSVDALMGWTSSSDTDTQLKMTFDSQQAAEDFAAREGLDYRVVQPKRRIVQPKSYSDNFRFDRIR